MATATETEQRAPVVPPGSESPAQGRFTKDMDQGLSKIRRLFPERAAKVDEVNGWLGEGHCDILSELGELASSELSVEDSRVVRLAYFRTS